MGAGYYWLLYICFIRIFKIGEIDLFADLSEGTKYEVFPLEEDDNGLGIVATIAVTGISMILAGGMHMISQRKAKKAIKSAVRSAYKKEKKLIEQEAKAASKLSELKFKHEMSLKAETQMESMTKETPEWVYWTVGGFAGFSLLYLILKH